MQLCETNHKPKYFKLAEIEMHYLYGTSLNSLTPSILNYMLLDIIIKGCKVGTCVSKVVHKIIISHVYSLEENFDQV